MNTKIICKFQSYLKNVKNIIKIKNDERKTARI